MTVPKASAIPMAEQPTHPHLNPNVLQTKTAQQEKCASQVNVRMVVVLMQSVLVVKYVAKISAAKAATATTIAATVNSVSKVDAKTTLVARMLTVRLEPSVKPQALLV